MLIEELLNIVWNKQFRQVGWCHVVYRLKNHQHNSIWILSGQANEGSADAVFVGIFGKRRAGYRSVHIVYLRKTCIHATAIVKS